MKGSFALSKGVMTPGRELLRYWKTALSAFLSCSSLSIHLEVEGSRGCPFNLSFRVHGSDKVVEFKQPSGCLLTALGVTLLPTKCRTIALQALLPLITLVAELSASFHQPTCSPPLTCLLSKQAQSVARDCFFSDPQAAQTLPIDYFSRWL